MNLRHIVTLLLLCTAPLAAQKFPATVKKSVTFIFSRDSTNRLAVQGTGFFLLMKAEQNGDTASFGYLATTKSVLQRNGKYLDSLYVRINRKGGASDTLIVPLRLNGEQRYAVHPDSTVDLVIIPAFPDVNRYDVLYIPVGLIAGSDMLQKENVTEGTELFYTGMMQSQFGYYRNIPAVRFGRIVQFSDEKYLWGGAFTEFYLMETELAVGASGSPVYYYADAVKDTGSAARPSKVLLAGIIAGPYSTGNSTSSLSRVIPAYKLNDMLNLPVVAGARDKEFQQLKQPPTK